MRRVAKEKWKIVPGRRRLASLMAAVVIIGGMVALLMVMFVIVRARPPVRPQELIGADVDGLALFDLNGSSRRVARFIEVVVRPLSYEVQSHPEQLEQDIERLLNVLTYRRAIGLVRSDDASGRDQWAVVVELKRMGDPIKVLVKQLIAREETHVVETTTSGVLFWRENHGPYFAVSRRAFVAASDRGWLKEVVRRLHHPLDRTARASHLLIGLPPASKHCLVRANVLLPPERWERWIQHPETTTGGVSQAGAIARLLRESGLHAQDAERLSLSATLQPRGQVRFDLSISCRPTSSALATINQIGDSWNRLAGNMRLPNIEGVTRPTTTTDEISFAWMTLPVEEMLGLSPAVHRPPPPR